MADVSVETMFMATPLHYPAIDYAELTSLYVSQMNKIPIYIWITLVLYFQKEPNTDFTKSRRSRGHD